MQYNQYYYLIDEIYLRCMFFFKAIKNPTRPNIQYFTKMQNAYRKDMEKAFGVLQSRFSIIWQPAHCWSIGYLQYIVMTYIILIIVEDESEEDELEPFDPEDISTLPKKVEIYDKQKSSNSSSSHSYSTIIKIMHVIMRYWRFSLLQPQVGSRLIEKRVWKISNALFTSFLYASCIFVRYRVFGRV